MKARRVFSWRSHRRSSVALAAVLCLYLSVLARPRFLFASVVASGNLMVYSHHPEAGLGEDMKRAEALLDAAPLHDSVGVHRLYLTSSYGEFAMFAPGAARSFGVTYPELDSSFLSVADAGKDAITRNGVEFKRRALSSVMAHESSHTVLEKHFGAARLLFVPRWKIEGYCDYVAGDRSAGDDAAGARLLARGVASSGAAEYFRGYARVKYLLEQKHLTVDEIFGRSFAVEELDREAIGSLESGSR